MSRFRNALRRWGRDNIEDYPWRYRESTYEALVAEFMLLRTQAKQVRPIYRRFLARYPSLRDFVQASGADVETLLRPLGLEWRNRRMISALQELWRVHGEVPADVGKLTSIGGIGQYIGGATVCFTKDRPMTLVDSNSVRVAGRFFGLDLSGEARRRRSVIGAIDSLCDPCHPRDFYYALIDLAHTVCTPREPECERCPLLDAPCEYGESTAGAMPDGGPDCPAGDSLTGICHSEESGVH